MNRGLEALEKLHKHSYEDMKEKIGCFKTIEKELKRLEDLDNGAYVSIHINRYNELCDKEKALEILKNKPFVDFQIIKHYDNVEELNKYIKFMYGYNCESILTQEEYDLLKGVLL